MALTQPFDEYYAEYILGLVETPTGIFTNMGLDDGGDVVKSPGVFNAMKVMDEAAAVQFRVVNNLNAVNNFVLSGAITGSGPVMACEGADANINYYFAAKGAGTVEFGNGAGGIFTAASGALNPNTNDAAALGDATHWWSDLFLATGGVINYGNGNVTITHSSGILTYNSHIVTSQSVKAASMFLDGATATNRLLYARTGTSTRWQTGADNTAEAGSDVGSDWVLLYYTDAGAFKGTALRVDRNGNVQMSKPALDSGAEVTAANLAAIGNAINTTGKVRGKLVWDSTNNRMMRARGAATSSVWDVVDGSASVTPV